MDQLGGDVNIKRQAIIKNDSIRNEMLSLSKQIADLTRKMENLKRQLIEIDAVSFEDRARVLLFSIHAYLQKIASIKTELTDDNKLMLPYDIEFEENYENVNLYNCSVIFQPTHTTSFQRKAKIRIPKEIYMGNVDEAFAIVLDKAQNFVKGSNKRISIIKALN